MPLDPWKLRSETIVLVGMAESSRHLAPYDIPGVEIWSLNESYHPRHTKGVKKDEEKKPYLRRWDRWFQIHPRWDFLREGNFNHPNHPLWMKAVKGDCFVCHGNGKAGDKVCTECAGTGEYDPAVHRRFEMDYPFPIYTVNQEVDIPGAVAYPLDEIVGSFGVNAANVRYFTNSFGVMVALALHLGAKRIEGYGWEMSSKTEYQDQKPNANFWAGICIGKGVEFYLPPGCTMLGDREQLYGFEKVPGLTSMHMEIQVNALAKAFDKAQGELNLIRGRKVELQNRAKVTQGLSKDGMAKMQGEMGKLVGDEFAKISEINSIFGALQQARRNHNEVRMHAAISELGYVDATGTRRAVSLAGFEADARKELEELANATQDNQITLVEADVYGEADAEI